MRLLKIVVALATLLMASDLYAFDMDEVRAAVKSANFDYLWANPAKGAEGQPDTLTDFSVAVNYDGPGKLSLIRTEKGSATSYPIQLTHVYTAYSDNKLDLRSSTCEKVKPQTQCSLYIQELQIGYEIVGANLPRNYLALDSMSNSFMIKWFPELLPGYQARLNCTDWSWVGGKIGATVSILNIGQYGSNSVSDLGTSPDTQERFLNGPITCKIGRNGCLLQNPESDVQPSEITAIPVFQIANIALTVEVAEGDSTCTTQFGVTTDIKIDVSGNYNPLPRKSVRTDMDPLIPKFRERLNEDFVADFQVATVASALGHNESGGVNNLDDIAVVLDMPWSVIANVISDTNSGNQVTLKDTTATPKDTP